jgi:hypothetical protein
MHQVPQVETDSTIFMVQLQWVDKMWALLEHPIVLVQKCKYLDHFQKLLGGLPM